MSTPLKPALAYVRQSLGRADETRDTSLSLEQQAESIREFAEKHGYQVERYIRDFDVTGRTLDRPGLTELRELVQPGMTVIVWKYDRLARSVGGHSILVDELQDRGASVISVTEPQGKLPRQMMAVFSEFYSDALSERISAIREAEARRGKFTGGQPPYGYWRSDTEDATNKKGETYTRRTGPLVIDPEPAEVIREMFRRYLAGEAMLSIAWDFERRGIETKRGQPWSQTVIRKMLRNPIYAGAIQLNGSIVTRDAHEPIISWETFDRVQTRLAEQVVVKRNDSGLVSWCQEFVYHSCGHRMYLYGIQRRAPNRKPIPSFGCQLSYGASTRRCTEDRRHIVVAKVEKAARACLVRDLSGVASLEDAIQRAHDAAGGREAEKARKALADRRTLAQRRHDRALEYWLSRREKLSLTWMDEKDAELEQEIAAIDRDIAALPTEPDTARYADVAKQLQTIAPLVELASPDAMREIMTRLGRIIVSGPGIQIDYRPEIRPFIPNPTLIIVPIRKHST